MRRRGHARSSCQKEGSALSRTKSEVSLYRTVHDIQGYLYLKRLTIDLYIHYLQTNGGLPMFIPGYYLGKLTDKITQDVAEDEVTDATNYFELLTGLTRGELLDSADAGQGLEFGSFFEEEMDFVVSERLCQHQEWFVEDVLAILEDERITCHVLQSDEEVAEEMQMRAYAGELTLFDTVGSRPVHPYKGGGFSCNN